MGMPQAPRTAPRATRGACRIAYASVVAISASVHAVNTTRCISDVFTLCAALTPFHLFLKVFELARTGTRDNALVMRRCVFNDYTLPPRNSDFNYQAGPNLADIPRYDCITRNVEVRDSGSSSCSRRSNVA